IIGRDFQSIIWADLNDTFFGVGAKAESATNKYLIQFTSATRTIRSAIERAKNPELPPVTIARRVSGDFGCPACEFRDICRDELESFDQNFGHVTLLSEVTAPKAAEHFSSIEDIRSLSEAEGLSDFGMKSALRAQVWLDKTPRVIDPANPPELAPYDVEIDIDLENTQAIFHEAELEEVAVSDRVYLYGYGVHDRTINPDWRSVEVGYFDDYQNSDEGELTVLNSMWQKIVEEVEKCESAGKSVAIFHYSQHEVTWWRNYAKKYEGREGVPTIEELNQFIQRYFRDLYRETKKIAFPLTGYSIKTLAKAAKFNWKVSDAGGGNSLVKFQTAISKQSSKSAQEEAIAWLRSYNADDVRATFAVRNWVRTLSLIDS
ncbi:MAG: ribonuclease H-like domain-containing protein, partial [Candidatus Nanopelagicaceae bacterium]